MALTPAPPTKVAAEIASRPTGSPAINLRDLVVGFADIGDAAVGVADMARYFIENERRANSQIVDVIFRRVLGGGDYDVGLGRRKRLW